MGIVVDAGKRVGLPMQLQQWFIANIPDDKMLYKEAAVKQVLFVRDYLAARVVSGFSHDKNCALVINVHLSKSILLPVYKITLKNGIVLILRDNFFDWKVSVISPFRIYSLDLEDLISLDDQVSPTCCEGFPDELIFGSFDQNNYQFTAELNTKYDLYALAVVLARMERQ